MTSAPLSQLVDEKLETSRKRWQLAHRFSLDMCNPKIVLPLALVGIFALALTVAAVPTVFCGLVGACLSGILHQAAKLKIEGIEVKQNMRKKNPLSRAMATAAAAIAAAAAPVPPAPPEPAPALESVPDLTQDFRDGTANALVVRKLRLKPNVAQPFITGGMT